MKKRSHSPRAKAADTALLRLPMRERALMAFKEAVEQVVQEHARLDLPLYILRDGKVVAVSARTVQRASKRKRNA